MFTTWFARAGISSAGKNPVAQIAATFARRSDAKILPMSLPLEWPSVR